MKKRSMALVLALCLLLGGCSLFSDPGPDDPGPTAPEAPVDDPQQDTPDPEPESVEPLALPVTGGIDWNDAPAQSVGEGGSAPDTVSRPLFQYNASGYCTYDTADSGVPDERGVLVRANTVEITGLRNLILQNRLNEFIDTHMQELFDEDPGVTQAELAEYAARNGAAHACVERSAYVNVMISGRVLTLEFSRVDSLLALDEQGEYFPTDEWVELASSDEFFSFDMHDGRQLRLRDLFFDGAEYAPVLDGAIADVLSLSEDEYRLKRPFRGLPEEGISWLSHGDYMAKVPAGFSLTAHSDACPNVAIADEMRGFYGVQFHPEVNHTENGIDMIRNFLYEVCHAAGDWTMEDY